MDANKLLVQNHLVKTNVQNTDEGYYRCLFRNYDTNTTKSDETYIKIYGEKFFYYTYDFLNNFNVCTIIKDIPITHCFQFSFLIHYSFVIVD